MATQSQIVAWEVQDAHLTGEENPQGTKTAEEPAQRAVKSPSIAVFKTQLNKAMADLIQH